MIHIIEITGGVIAVFLGIFIAYALIFLGNPDNYR